jgi:hypothetical protein
MRSKLTCVLVVKSKMASMTDYFTIIDDLQDCMSSKLSIKFASLQENIESTKDSVQTSCNRCQKRRQRQPESASNVPETRDET